MLDTATGEVVHQTLTHEGESVREFYATLPGPVGVGIEATGSMKWFVNLMEELGIDCQVGHPATIRAAEPRRQKHDQRDAELLLKLLVENRFPSIWQPSKELLDLRGLLLHRHQWVRLRTRISISALGGECASSTASLLINYMPPRITRKSYGPGASDRTVVDNVQPNSLPCFRIRKRRHENRMDLRRANTSEPLNWTWAGERSEYFCSFQSPEMFFLLTLPFIERAYRRSEIPSFR
jgi:hypothetical protein